MRTHLRVGSHLPARLALGLIGQSGSDERRPAGPQGSARQPDPQGAGGQEQAPLGSAYLQTLVPVSAPDSSASAGLTGRATSQDCVPGPLSEVRPGEEGVPHLQASRSLDLGRGCDGSFLREAAGHGTAVNPASSEATARRKVGGVLPASQARKGPVQQWSRRPASSRQRPRRVYSSEARQRAMPASVYRWRRAGQHPERWGFPARMWARYRQAPSRDLTGFRPSLARDWQPGSTLGALATSEPLREAHAALGTQAAKPAALRAVCERRQPAPVLRERPGPPNATH